MKTRKFIAMAVSLMLILNTFAGVSMNSFAAEPGWIWRAASDGYINLSGLVAEDVDGIYTTFTANATDGYFYPGQGAGDLTASPSLGAIDATTNKYAVIRYRTSAVGAVGQMLAGNTAPDFQQNYFNYSADGQWHEDIIDLSIYSSWTGLIKWFRLDIIDNVASGSIDIDYLAFFATRADAEEYTGNVYTDPVEITTFHTSVDQYNVDGTWTVTGGGGGASVCYTFPDVITVEDKFGFDGWAATSNGIAKYQYSLDGVNFTDITDAAISAHGGLEAAGVPYAGGHDTAKFTIYISVSDFAVGENSVTIRAIDKADNWFDFIKATVKVEADEYTITVGDVTNGSVSVNKETALAGETVTVTATPDTGYELESVIVDGTSIMGNTFTVTGNHTVSASFKEVADDGILGYIYIDAMNENIWAQPYKTILFDSTYSGSQRGVWQHTLICTYNETLDAYVIETELPGDGTGETSYVLNENQIIINGVTSSESYIASGDAWTTVEVGSVLDLYGIDLENKTVSDGAYAAIIEADSDNNGDNTGDNTGDNAGDSTGDNAGDNTDDNAGDSTGDNTGDNAGDSTGDNAGDNAGDNTDDNTGDTQNSAEVINPGTADASISVFVMLMAVVAMAAVVFKRKRA